MKIILFSFAKQQYNTLKPDAHNILLTIWMPHRQLWGINLLEVVSCSNANPQLPVPWLISGDDPHSEVSEADYRHKRRVDKNWGNYNSKIT